MIDIEEVFPNLDQGTNNKFIERFFLPTIEEMQIFILTVFGDTFITIASFSLSAVALFGYCLYIVYFKSNNENEKRLLNWLTYVLTITDISTTITSVAMIIYNYDYDNYEGWFVPFWKILKIYIDSEVNTSSAQFLIGSASDISWNFKSKYLAISLVCKIFVTMVLHFFHLLLVKHHQQGQEH